MSIEKGRLRQAGGKIVQCYAKAVMRVCGNMLRGILGDDAVDDIVQDIFIKVCDALPRFRPGAPVRPWLFGIVRRHCLQVLRNHWNRRRLLHEQQRKIAAANHRDPLDSLDDDTMAQETHTLIQYGLTQLRKRDRELLVMRYFEEQTLEEMARRFGCGETTMRERLQAAYVDWDLTTPEGQRVGFDRLLSSLATRVSEEYDGTRCTREPTAATSAPPTAALEFQHCYASLFQAPHGCRSCRPAPCWRGQEPR
jgi:RNA polymerase sigma-70 factor (ECF subfamily)